MFPQLTLHVVLALAVLSSTVTLASPAPKAADVVTIRKNLVTVPLARRHALSGTSIFERDQARVGHLRTKAALKGKSFEERQRAAGDVTVPVTNGAVTYTADINVGNPPQPFTLIVDTGSSNTWAGAHANKRVKTGGRSGVSSSGQLVQVTYGSGFVLGTEVSGPLTVGGLSIPTQSFGSAILDQGFDDVDGIIGIGPTDLTDGTTSGGGTVPTVTDNAFTSGVIDSKVVGISFAPTTSLSDVNGQLTFGGIDESLFTGPLTTVPITSTSPASEFVGIDQTITYAGQTLLTSSGITDTGTTLTLLATDAFDKYTAATGAVMDSTTGLLSITPAQFANLQSLFFTIGGTTFEFTPNAQLWPRALNSAIGGSADGIFLIIGDLGTTSGQGLDFINGMTFLERFFTVFDSGKSEFSIATTSHTLDTTN